MSIFGKRQKYVWKAYTGDQEGLTQQLADFRQDVHNSRGIIMGQINAFNDRVSQLQDHIREAAVRNAALKSTVEQIRPVIAIFAEAKGAIKKTKIFSFGNGGRESEVAFVLPRDGRILGMGLSCEKGSENLWVTLSVNGQDQLGYGVVLGDGTKRNHDNFKRPLDVYAGSAIGFVCQTDVPSAKNAVVSLLIELL